MVYTVDLRLWEKAVKSCRNRAAWHGDIMPYYQRTVLKTTSMFVLGSYLTPVQVKIRAAKMAAEADYWTDVANSVKVISFDAYLESWLRKHWSDLPQNVRDCLNDDRRTICLPSPQPGNLAAEGAQHHRIGPSGVAG